MCDISTKSKKKTVVVYKIAIKDHNEYYSHLFQMKIKTGKVKNMPIVLPEYHRKGSGFYNDIMADKKLTTGFAYLRNAREFYKSLTAYERTYLVIIRLKLSGEIYEGTTLGYFGDAKFNKIEIENFTSINVAKVYAGSVIDEIKEV